MKSTFRILFMLEFMIIVSLAEETNFLAIENQANKTMHCSDKVQYQVEMTKLINAVKDLSEAEKKTLYSKLATQVKLTTEDPFADQDKWNLVGVLLSQTKDEDLICDILIRTPPPSVAFLPLEDFIKDVPPALLARIIRDGAAERFEKRKKADG